ncbi:MAG TPA: M14 family metallopeptidase [Casimicrobiaceae bacterium]|jgi:murein tripeptide amidase MpaA|nr:M14 family metallopeptidase [Casimicrobiaceae bacterium]
MPAAFDRFYRYDELTKLLHTYAREHPRLVAIESIGRSHEGRDIWVLTVTNTATGPASEKPAFWVDGNIHSTEVAASAATLYFLDTLVSGHGRDADITRALDTRAFYLCPRINPDGAEWALADKPKWVRSSTRPYPFEEEDIEGLVVEDIDGDGRILQMRIEDPNGLWKAHPEQPRLLVRRDPTETGGTYYRVLPEGRYEHWDGFTLKIKKPRHGLDLNRNFPAGWRQEFEQVGSGPYPTSEPEVRAVADFVVKHPNITGGTSFHTWSGVLLRPLEQHPDEEMDAEDLWVYQTMGKKGTELTGYPAISVYHEFRYHPKSVIGGTFDWIYEHLGIFSWVVEIWAPMREAGIANYKYIDWFRDHPIEDDLKLFRWSEDVLGGLAHQPWRPFDHPQLGRVEIGGWNRFHAFGNPPLPLLEKEIARFPRWLLWQSLISPRLALVHAGATRLAGDTWKITLVVQNEGYLPTYVSKRALKRKTARGVVAELDLPPGLALEAGKLRDEHGQLEGRAYKHTGVSFWPDYNVTDDRMKLEWVVRGPAAQSVAITARHERAGTVRTTVELT